MNLTEYQNRIFQIENESSFNELCLTAFLFQYQNIAIYRQYVDALSINPHSINHFSQIPFLPISFFKTHSLIAGEEQTVFKSSGTTDTGRSHHYIHDLKLYENSFRESFKRFYGPVQDYAILALLPSYIENGESSLIYMADSLIHDSKHQSSGFYLDNLQELSKQIRILDKSGQKTLLLGVSYALLDLIETYSFELKHTIVMETGGMKGQRKELVKSELHALLKSGFGVDTIHSEYGMTELLSQAYSKGKGLFEEKDFDKIDNLIRY